MAKVFPYWGLRRKNQMQVTGTAAELADQVVAAGMFAEASDSGVVKRGDGVRTFSDLPHFGVGPNCFGELVSMDRWHSGDSVEYEASGKAAFTYFTADQDMTVGSLSVSITDTAAGATPTLCKLAVYSVGGGGGLTLVAETANDPSMFNEAWSTVVRPVAAAGVVSRGERLAAAVLVVSGSALPKLVGRWVNYQAGNDVEPRLVSAVSGLTDFPSAVDGVDVEGESRGFFVRVIAA